MKRILFVGEASFLATGFGTYTHEILTRLHATGRYELAEYSSYGEVGDERAEGLPWKYYTAMPNRKNPGETELYHSQILNQFGEWKFEEVLLDFRPDVTLTVRDHWMDEFVERSPFRPYFRWIWMPTVDAAPQAPGWLASFASTDLLLTYSDWALSLLNTQGIHQVYRSASPGADYDTFCPVPDKRKHKESLGVPADALIVGTVMRNQKRKLYPDLIASFRLFLEKAPAHLAKKTFLYLHTCYPDLGWDIPELIKEAGVGSRTLFTYVCSACGMSFPSFYADAQAYCRACKRHTATLANARQGSSRQILARVYNFFDVYVQYANSEGLGMPQIEAAACGVPVFAIDYSAMSDVVAKIGGVAIRPLTLSREAETGCFRAIPDNEDFVNKLIGFLKLPESVRLMKGRASRRLAMEHFNYDKAAKVWEEAVEMVGQLPRSQTWDGPARLHRLPTAMPEGLSGTELVRWGLEHLAGRPDLLTSHTALRMARDLGWGTTLGFVPRSSLSDLALLGIRQEDAPYTREACLNECAQMGMKKNYWEERRTRK